MLLTNTVRLSIPFVLNPTDPNKVIFQDNQNLTPSEAIEAVWIVERVITELGVSGLGDEYECDFYDNNHHIAITKVQDGYQVHVLKKSQESHIGLLILLINDETVNQIVEADLLNKPPIFQKIVRFSILINHAVVDEYDSYLADVTQTFESQSYDEDMLDECAYGDVINGVWGYRFDDDEEQITKDSKITFYAEAGNTEYLERFKASDFSFNGEHPNEPFGRYKNFEDYLDSEVRDWRNEHLTAEWKIV